MNSVLFRLTDKPPRLTPIRPFLGLECEPGEVLLVVTHQSVLEASAATDGVSVVDLGNLVLEHLGCNLLYLDDTSEPLCGLSPLSSSVMTEPPEQAAARLTAALEESLQYLDVVSKIVLLGSLNETVRYGAYLQDEIEHRTGIPMSLALSEDCQPGVFISPVSHMVFRGLATLTLTVDPSRLMRGRQSCSRLVAVSREDFSQIIPHFWQGASRH